MSFSLQFIYKYKVCNYILTLSIGFSICGMCTPRVDIIYNNYIKCCIVIIAIIVIIIIYLFISRKCDQPVKDILIMEGSVINKHIVD